jgi:putative chitinase
MTLEQLKEIMPRCQKPEQYLPYLNTWLAHYGITTKARICHFMAQIAHESNQLNSITENLNYSAQGLIAIFPDRFNIKKASQYARQPEKIANLAYSNKGGNGNEESGDGWRYRVLGAIQCTLKNNYAAAAKDWNVDLIQHPDLLAEPDGAIRSATWYWWKNGLNKMADDGATIKQITSKINRKCLGLAEREAYYKKAIQIIF